MINDLKRISRRAMAMIWRGRVQLVDDSGPVQTLQLKLNSLEVLDKVSRVSEFGFSSVPPANCDAIVVFLNGERSSGVVIATGDQASRFKNLKPGETVFYDAFGKSIWLKQSGGIVVEANGADVTVNNGGDITLNATGNVIVNSPSVQLGAAGGKKVVLDGDPVSGGVVHASSTNVTAT